MIDKALLLVGWSIGALFFRVKGYFQRCLTTLDKTQEAPDIKYLTASKKPDSGKIN